MKLKKVVVAMSGGVDSAVTAAILKNEGYEVIGITLQIWQEHSDQGKHGGCCSLGAVEDARRAASKIGIPHYVLNFRDYFAEKVIDNFISEYKRGRTPNPCVECNRSVKFEELLRHADELGADYLATGHYGRIRFNEETSRFELLRARDKDKDQSYALYTLSQYALSRTLMPLGYLENKHETRQIASNLGLSIANKPDSQEICFVPKEGYVKFLQEKAPDTVKPGKIVNLAGEEIGEHTGIAHYTIGQRKRMPGGKSGPLFVLKLDAATNILTAGSDEDLYAEGFEADTCVWSAIDKIDRPMPAMCKIRYNGTVSKVIFNNTEIEGKIECRFESPQRAVTPGQSAVFYGGDGAESGQVVLGGGIISNRITSNMHAQAIN